MIELSIPATFDRALALDYAELNRRHRDRGIRIAEVYGALPGRDSARAPDSLPQVDIDALFDYARALRADGIAFRYTMNSVRLNAADMDAQYRPFLERLLDTGIDRVSVASPDVVKFLGRVFRPGAFDITASTIIQADSVRRVEQMLELGARQVVLDIRANRNFELLSQFRRHAERFDGRLVIMVNEFCGDCALRFNHYILQSSEDGERAACTPGLEGYPFTDCIGWFMATPARILKGYWVLPQWLERYRDQSGIRCFKIAGRTVANPDWHRKVVGAYMAGRFDGNVLDLEPSDDTVLPFALAGDTLDAGGYLDHFIDARPRCASQCGVSCRFCDTLAERLFAAPPVQAIQA